MWDRKKKTNIIKFKKREGRKEKNE